jgi:hypothetical protein
VDRLADLPLRERGGPEVVEHVRAVVTLLDERVERVLRAGHVAPSVGLEPLLEEQLGVAGHQAALLPVGGERLGLGQHRGPVDPRDARREPHLVAGVLDPDDPCLQLRPVRRRRRVARAAPRG